MAILIVLIATVGGAFTVFRNKDEVIAVQVDQVARRDLTEIVVASGRIQPVTQVIISPEVAGEIIDLPVVEGQLVKPGDLLLQLKRDNYQASRNSAEAHFKFAQGSRQQAEAELEKAEADFRQNEQLFANKLISASIFTGFKTAYEVAKLRLANSLHQSEQARFALDKAEDELAKTRITSPIEGTVTKLKSQRGERVLGTSFNMGTEIMTIARLDEMEARVDIGEIDVVLIAVGQTARVEVDAFKDRKFKGAVTAIANAAKGAGSDRGASAMSSSQSQEAPKFEVRIRVLDQEAFRPGMSVTAEIETRSRKGVLSVPIQSVTTRLPEGAAKEIKAAKEKHANEPRPVRPAKSTEPIKPIEVVFAREKDRAKMIPVKTGISDSEYFEITDGLREGQEIISGGYKAVSKDLEAGKKVKLESDTAKKGIEKK